MEYLEGFHFDPKTGTLTLFSGPSDNPEKFVIEPEVATALPMISVHSSGQEAENYEIRPITVSNK